MNSKHTTILITALLAMLAVSIALPGCSRNGSQGVVERVLIRVGSSTVSVREFHEAFESSITSPSVLYGDPEALRSERYQTLNRLIEELVILERAKELRVEVSDEELALAVNDFKQDFPDDTFEQTLIENGVSYLVWEKGLKRRLLMEKVIRQDFSESSFQVPLPADEVVTTAMDANFEAQISLDAETAPEDEKGKTLKDTSEAVPEDAAEAPDETVDTAEPEGMDEPDFSLAAAENKAESEYAAWMGRLKEQYTIEIDWKLWEEIEQEDIGDT